MGVSLLTLIKDRTANSGFYVPVHAPLGDAIQIESISSTCPQTPSNSHSSGIHNHSLQDVKGC